MLELSEYLTTKEIEIVCDEHGYDDYQKAIRHVRHFYTKEIINI